MGCGGEEQKMISWPQASRREDEREGNGLKIEDLWGVWCEVWGIGSEVEQGFDE